MLEIINSSAAGSGATKVKTPLLLEDNYAPAFALALMLKDILLTKDVGAGSPLTKTLVETYTAAAENGLAKEEVIGIINYIKKK